MDDDLASAAASPSPVWADFRIAEHGKHHGYLRVPHSTDCSAYGSIRIPAISLRNGDGPRVALMAGNHGDEFEGQVLVMNLARELRPDDVRGSLLLLPAINAPAAAAGTRTSPIDGGNLNRCFPGVPNGSPTHMIAHYLSSQVVPNVDFIFDFHSGGASLDYLPLAHGFMEKSNSSFRKLVEILKSFGMQNSMIVEPSDGNGSKLTSVCQRAGTFHMSTELGGGGRLNSSVLAQAEQGIRRVLFDLGSLRRKLTDSLPVATRFLHRQSSRGYLYAPCSGLFEPAVEIGSEVVTGQYAGSIHYTDEPWKQPLKIEFQDSGIVLARRAIPRCSPADGLFTLGHAANFI